MLSIAMKDMFFYPIQKPNKRDIESMYRELCDMFRQKHEQHMDSQKRVVELTQKLRDSTEESRQLMLTIARHSNKETKLKDAHQEELSKHQKLTSDLSAKNKDLEKRLMDMSDHINTSIAAKSFTGSDTIESPANEKTVNKITQNASANEEAEVIDLSFTPKFQAILEKHAQKCHG